jgi:NAD(P)-dependent dehydrogenase (short-subunit alcohol dehydrogenase family)
MSEARTKAPVAVVTGAAQGIGRKVALVLAERGYAVAANDHSTPEGTLATLEQVGAETLAIPGDVSDEEAVLGMVRGVMERFECVDVLVNNARISLIMPAEETPLADWRRVIEVNFMAPFLMCREFGREMLRQG